MLLIPATIIEPKKLFVPATIEKKHDYVIPAHVNYDRYFMIKDFIYHIKPIIENSLDLGCISDRIIIEIINSGSEDDIIIQYPPEMNMFTISVNKYSIDRKYRHLSIYEYLDEILYEFAAEMRKIYQYVNLYGEPGMSTCEYLDINDLSDSETILQEDVGIYAKEITDKLGSVFYNIERYVVFNQARSISELSNFDIVGWIYYCANSVTLQILLEQLNIDTLVSYQNMYLYNQDDIYYLIDYNLDVDICVVQFNCNIQINKDKQSIIDYTVSLFTSSIIDLAKEFIDDGDISLENEAKCIETIQCIDLFSERFKYEISLFFDEYVSKAF